MNEVMIQRLFPPGSSYMALPSKTSPQFYFSSGKIVNNWKYTASFPAYRSLARFRKFLLRLSVLTPGRYTYMASNHVDWVLEPFVSILDRKVENIVVMIGTPGSCQKITVQLWDNTRVCGYLKLGNNQRAKNAIKNEYAILNQLPKNIAASTVSLLDSEIGLGLLLFPIEGDKVTPLLPVDEDIINYLDKLVSDKSYHFYEHPWIKLLVDYPYSFDWDSLMPLTKKKWFVVINHGDYAPWNIIRNQEQKIQAIDWERGCLEGFQFYDFAYYILQVAFLIYRYSPEKALSHGVSYMSKCRTSGINENESLAILKLTAYAMYCFALDEGQVQKSEGVRWYKKVWLIK